jgi:PAS domain S-box-containing protein
VTKIDKGIVMEDQTAPTGKTPNFAPKLYSITLIVVALVLAGLWVMSRFVALDVARDLNDWKDKLNLIAESRSADVNHYVEQHFGDLRTLANNPSLQLYLSELKMMEEDGSKTKGQLKAEPAQMAYLRNLLIFTAERSGYSSTNAMSTIPANVEEASMSGLAIVNQDQAIVVSTNLSKATREMMLANVKKQKKAAEKLIDIERNGSQLSIGFMVPIYAIQTEQTPENAIGWVVGITSPSDGLYGLMKHPGVTEKTLEALLLRDGGNDLDFISPLLDKTEPLTIVLAKDTQRSVEVESFKNTGNFYADLKDHMRKAVLSTTRKINNTPWILQVKVERDEALKVSTNRRNSMVAMFFMLLAVVILLVIALWWHGSSKRSLMMSHYFRQMAEKSQAQENILRLVTDNIPEPIYILDKQHHIKFANQAMADVAGMQPDSVAGKNIRDVRGAAAAEVIIENCQAGLRSQQIQFATTQLEKNGHIKTLQSAYIPVAHIPETEFEAATSGVLVLEQDISHAINEREKRIKINQSLVQTLVKLVDRRDPFAANHSLLVSQLAMSVAVEMGQNTIITETAQIAGSLMNVGKIIVPRALLTKTDKLSADERKVIHDSVYDAAELIKHIPFEGPVYDTLRQWQEKWDGTGPLSLRGESIILPARILAVVNAYVGMISPRSWRHAISHEDASKFLMNNVDASFDRRVVIAIVHFLENQAGKAWLAGITEKMRSV